MVAGYMKKYDKYEQIKNIAKTWDVSEATKKNYLGTIKQVKNGVEQRIGKELHDIYKLLERRSDVMTWINEEYKDRYKSQKGKICAIMKFLKNNEKYTVEYNFYSKEWERIKKIVNMNEGKVSANKLRNWVERKKLTEFFKKQFKKCKKLVSLKHAQTYEDLPQKDLQLLEETVLMSLWLSNPEKTPPRRCGSYAKMRIVQLTNKQWRDEETYIYSNIDDGEKELEEKGNFLYRVGKSIKMMKFGDYKSTAFKGHGLTTFYKQNENKPLQWLLNKWISLSPVGSFGYDTKRHPFLFPKKTNPMEHWEQSYMTKRIKKAFHVEFPKKNISSSMLRNIIISEFNFKHTAHELKEWARLCGHDANTSLFHYTHKLSDSE